MTVVIDNIIVTGVFSTLIQFSSDEEDPTFYIYLDGSLIDTTTDTEYTLDIDLDDSYILDILDNANEEPLQVFGGKVRLCFYYSDSVDYYRIDEYISEVWTPRMRLQETGGYLQFESRLLEDSQTHQFRIVPVGTNGNEGTAKTFTILCVRNPDVPDIDYAYDSETAKITITAGA